MAQEVSGLRKGTYTFSAYVKTENVVPQAYQESLGAAVGVDFLNGSRQGQCLTSTETVWGTSDPAIDDGWQRISITFSVPEDGTKVRVWGGLSYASGQAWFDSFQLEDGDVPEGYNLIENPGFERAGGDSGLRGWTVQGQESGDGQAVGAARFHQNSVILTGNPQKSKYVVQTLPLSGKEGDVYSLSCWALAHAVPGKAFRLFARVWYTDDTYKDHVFDYDPYLTGWQFAGGMVSTDDDDPGTDKNYYCIQVFLEYSNQCNTVLFDGVQLTRDEGTTYVYDDDGNLISAADAAEKSQFQMDGSGNLTKMVNPTGSSYTYSYDAKQNLTYARNSDGLSYQFTYDQYGNPVNAVYTGNGTGQNLEEGKAYCIVNKETGLALDVAHGADQDGREILIQPLYQGVLQQFRLIRQSDGYYRIVAAASDTGRVLTMKDNGTADGTHVVIRTDQGASIAEQQFQLEWAKEGGFRILARNTSNASCLGTGGKEEGGSPVVLEKKDTKKDSQLWYFEPLESGSGGIRSSQTYTANGRQVASTTDATGETVTYQYDSYGRLKTGVTDPSGVTESYRYDSNDRLTQVSKPISEGSGATASVSYTYANDKLSRITHNGSSYQFVYDAFGNNSQVKVGDQAIVTQSLLPNNGDVSQKTYGNGDTVSYGYDKYSRVTQVNYDGTAAFRYQYDSHGDEVSHSDLLNGVEFFFKYDGLGRNVLMTTDHGQRLKVGYDDKNRVTRFVSEVDGSSIVTEYVYGI